MPPRVIAGIAGGRVLKSPSGDATRPTSDRVREAIFEILASRAPNIERVLDLYSGTGAMGIEALSRGAIHCDFVESGSKACQVIKQNLALTRLQDGAQLFQEPVSRALGRLTGSYDLVVADPPYEYDRAERELDDLVNRQLLTAQAIIVVEHSKRREWPDQLASLSRFLSRRYGDTNISLYQLPQEGV